MQHGCQNVSHNRSRDDAQVVPVQRCGRMRPSRPAPGPTTGSGRMLASLAPQRRILRRLAGCGVMFSARFEVSDGLRQVDSNIRVGSGGGWTRISVWVKDRYAQRR